MTGLKLILEPDKGVSVSVCAKEAVRVATILRIDVVFVFNDVLLTAQPDMPYTQLLERFHNARQVKA